MLEAKQSTTKTKTEKKTGAFHKLWLNYSTRQCPCFRICFSAASHPTFIFLPLLCLSPIENDVLTRSYKQTHDMAKNMANLGVSSPPRMFAFSISGRNNRTDCRFPALIIQKDTAQLEFNALWPFVFPTVTTINMKKKKEATNHWRQGRRRFYYFLLLL